MTVMVMVMLTVMVMVMLTTKIHKYQILDTGVRVYARLDRVKKRDYKKRDLYYLGIVLY